MRAVVLLVLVACGRVSFDPRGADGDGGARDGAPCVPIGHDEDQDGIDDDCDVCPHIADLGQPDADGDGVGDACDPSAAATHDIVFFDGFSNQRVEWAQVLPLANDQLAAPAGYYELQLDLVPGQDTFTVGGAVGAAGSPPRQITLVAATTTNRIHYCELYEVPPLKFGLVYYDGNSYVTADDAYQSTPLANQAFMLSLQIDGGTDRCQTTWPGFSSLAAAIPDLGPPSHYELVLNQTPTQLDYVVVIRAR